VSEKTDNLNVQVDFRLMPLYAQLFRDNMFVRDLPEELTEAFYAILRAAYARGYADALVEVASGDPGRLSKDTGYAIPGTDLAGA
jgi:hypothetical protein